MFVFDDDNDDDNSDDDDDDDNDSDDDDSLRHLSSYSALDKLSPSLPSLAWQRGNTKVRIC